MKNKLFIIFFIFINVLAFTQISNGNKIMESGLNNFSKGNYTPALGDFREIVLDPNFETLHGTAYYWIARCYMAQNLLDKAENNLDFFIQNFSGNKLFSEAVYQKGRLLFRKGDYDSAIQIFYKFIDSYSDHPFVSNGYFWIAESLFYLGHLEESKMIYSMIIREYPNSYKLETSKYKLSLITLKFRENELLKLIKISHEEYLKALEEFQRREKTYEQTISSYQRRLLASTSDDHKVVVSDMTEELSLKDKSLVSMEREIVRLNQTINDLVEQLANLASDKDITLTTSVGTDTSKSFRLLEVKNSALKLKEFYINWLASRIGE